MKNIAFFGGTGGLGKEVVKYLSNYYVECIGSSQVDFNNLDNIDYHFYNNYHDIVIIFTNYNYDSFIHKLDRNNLIKQNNINIVGVDRCITNALQYMRNNSYGRIIIASSVLVDSPVVGTGVYSATKAYYETLVKTIALENGIKNITANCIHMGYMEGGLTDHINSRMLSEIVDRIPCKRLGKPEEIAKTIDFIINNDYINGSTIKLTGGL